jgi:putative redox protein
LSSRVVDQTEAQSDFIRRKALTAHSDATMRSVIDTGEYGRFVLDEPTAHGGSGEGPSPLQAVLGALCGCEAVTFRRTATELGFDYDSLDFEAAFTIDIRGRQGDRSVRPHFQTVRVRAVVATEETDERLREVVEETEARCPVFNLIQDANVDLAMEWVRDTDG